VAPYLAFKLLDLVDALGRNVAQVGAAAEDAGAALKRAVRQQLERRARHKRVAVGVRELCERRPQRPPSVAGAHWCEDRRAGAAQAFRPAHTVNRRREVVGIVLL
jgi:hypothetical protein